MTEYKPAIDQLRVQIRDQVHLAVIAETVPVAEMHLDLALFSGERARSVERLGNDS